MDTKIRKINEPAFCSSLALLLLPFLWICGGADSPLPVEQGLARIIGAVCFIIVGQFAIGILLDRIGFGDIFGMTRIARDIWLTVSGNSGSEIYTNNRKLSRLPYNLGNWKNTRPNEAHCAESYDSGGNRNKATHNSETPSFQGSGRLPEGPSDVKERNGPSQIGNPLTPFRFRVSPDMAERIKAESRHDGLTESAWVRGVLADRLAMNDPADRQPVRRYGGLSTDVRELMALRMQLHQLGGLLVQTAKASRLAGQAEQHADLEATLVEIRNAIAVIHGLQRGAR